MPRTRFDKLAAPKRDPIKATILEDAADLREDIRP